MRWMIILKCQTKKVYVHNSGIRLKKWHYMPRLWKNRSKKGEKLLQKRKKEKTKWEKLVVVGMGGSGGGWGLGVGNRSIMHILASGYTICFIYFVQHIHVVCICSHNKLLGAWWITCILVCFKMQDMLTICIIWITLSYWRCCPLTEYWSFSGY